MTTNNDLAILVSNKKASLNNDSSGFSNVLSLYKSS